MQKIACPWCGIRSETEFTCGGELVVRPESPQEASDEEWTNYLFFRKNIRGVHTEVWRHTAGCRMWFKVKRDTINHRVIATLKLNCSD